MKGGARARSRRAFLLGEGNGTARRRNEEDPRQRQGGWTTLAAQMDKIGAELLEQSPGLAQLSIVEQKHRG
jgi:hypothetical protein